MGRFLICLSALGLMGAEPTARHPDAAAQFATGVSLVEVYATVTDAAGVPVTDLTAGDFVVEEDGARQAIAAFAAGEFPLAVAVGLDRSFSMTRDRLERAVTAVRQFVRGLRLADQLMILAIGSETEVLSPLSPDHARAAATLTGLEPWGTTPLYDATLDALAAIETAAGRRALILVSDGADRYSEAVAATVIDRARRADVLVYPILIGRTRPPVFAELASVSGGRSFHVTDLRRLPSTLDDIARELRSQYLLGYNPPAAGERGGWRSIRVHVTRPDVRVRARDGYYAR